MVILEEMFMCEAHAYLLENGVESRILESVDLVELEDDTVKLTSIFGEQKSLKARLRSYSNSEGKLVFEEV
jgi:predicted RNA-binding protein